MELAGGIQTAGETDIESVSPVVIRRLSEPELVERFPNLAKLGVHADNPVIDILAVDAAALLVIPREKSLEIHLLDTGGDLPKFIYSFRGFRGFARELYPATQFFITCVGDPRVAHFICACGFHRVKSLPGYSVYRCELALSPEG